jgi:hypothetical protein
MAYGHHRRYHMNVVGSAPQPTYVPPGSASTGRPKKRIDVAR